METKGGDGPTLSYDDFEPFCNWRHEEGSETLVIHLREFKKEQMKVQLGNRGTLTIFGERPIGGNKMSRFHKEIKVPQGCNANETRAMLEGGLLYIIMPKTTTALVTKELDSNPPKTSQEQQVVLVKPEKTSISGEKVMSSRSENTMGDHDFKAKQQLLSLRSKRLPYMAMPVVAVVLAVVVSALYAYLCIGIYR